MSILDTVISLCQKGGHERVVRVRLRIGRLAGIVPDALEFAFDAAKNETIAHGAELVIDHVPIGGTCQACKKEFALPEESLYVFLCPSCGSQSFVISQGREMEIVDMDVE